MQQRPMDSCTVEMKVCSDAFGANRRDATHSASQ
jgi:hypothetical protein